MVDKNSEREGILKKRARRAGWGFIMHGSCTMPSEMTEWGRIRRQSTRAEPIVFLVSHKSDGGGGGSILSRLLGRAFFFHRMI